MPFYVQKMPFWYTNFQNSPYRGKGGGGGDYPHPHPPLLGRSAPSLCPLLKNSGYTTGTDGAKKAQ